MAHAALIEAVQQKAAAAVAAIWADARTEAARCRDAADRSIEQQREQYKSRLQAVSAAARQAATADAVSRSRLIRGTAKAAVADRAHALALAALAGLRDTRYPDRFRALAEELPKREWRRVTVNPADAALARLHFPGADVAADAAISGGVMAEDETIERGDRVFEPMWSRRRKVVEDFPKAAEFHEQLAVIGATCRRRLDESLTHAERAVHLRPKQVSSRLALARVRLARGEGDAAQVHIREALDLEPQSVEAAKLQREIDEWRENSKN